MLEVQSLSMRYICLAYIGRHQGMVRNRRGRDGEGGRLVDQLRRFHLGLPLSWLDRSLWSWRRLLISGRGWAWLIFSQPSSCLKIKSLGTLLIHFLLNIDTFNEEPFVKVVHTFERQRKDFHKMSSIISHYCLFGSWDPD